MIPYSACMCFNQTGRKWAITKSQKNSLVELTVVEGKLVLSITEKPARSDQDVQEERPWTRASVHHPRPTCITSSEWSLLKSLEMRTDPGRVTSRFLTPQRRRSRSRTPVMKPKSFKSGLLDEAYTGVVKCMLEDSDRWSFNTFHLDVATGGRSLSVLLVHLFHSYGFIDTFKLDMVKVWRCFSLIESCYHSSNPYHNSVHAADVTQAMHCFLQQKKILSKISALEAMSALLAAVTHDLDHPGVNQPFLIATSNHLASLYKNFSVLENHHWRMAVSCLRESGIFDHLETDTWNKIEALIHSLILATDITRQQEFLSKFKRLLEAGSLNLDEPLYRHFILQIALKCADLCNPCRPWLISQRWSHQVCLEFYKQGDFEKKLNLPLTPICDRAKTSIPKIQADFFRFVVTPLFEIWDKFLDSDLSRQLIDNLRYNQVSWDGKVAASLQKPELPVPPRKEDIALEDVVEEVEKAKEVSDKNRFNWVLRSTVEDDCSMALWSRRCSMPLSLPKLLPRMVLRRQSFPHTHWQTNPDLTAYPIHRSPHMSLRTLSAEQLQPKTSIVSLSSSSGTAVSLLELFQLAEETESGRKGLVHQPMSYPPFVPARTARDADLVLVEESECGETPSEESRPLLVAEAAASAYRRKSGSSESDCSNGGGCSSRPATAHAQISDTNDSRDSSTNNGNNNNNKKDTPDPPTKSPAQTEGSERTEILATDASKPGRNTLKRSMAICRDSPDSSPTIRRLSHPLPLSPPPDPNPEGIPRLVIEEDPDSSLKSSVSKEVSSWCSRVSRSLSEDRPDPASRDFDSPTPSWKSSSSSLCVQGGPNSRLVNRRGSAPVSLPSNEPPVIAPPRRWSMATEAAINLGLTLDRDPMEDEIPSPLSLSLPLGKELIRRHSFGILESFVGAPSSESENDGSSTDPTSTGTTCSTRRNSSVVLGRGAGIGGHGRGDSFESRCQSVEQDGSCGSESRDIFPSRSQPSRNALGRRRGSLPADIPISLASRVQETWGAENQGLFAPRTWGEYQSRRRASAGEVLGAFVGQQSALAALHEMTTRTPSPEQEVEEVSLPGGHHLAVVFPRRASGGLELLSGLWRSNLSVNSVGDQGLPSRAAFYAQFSKHRNFPFDQKDTRWVSRLPLAPCRSKERLVTGQRRSSVPLDLALFSTRDAERPKVAFS